MNTTFSRHFQSQLTSSEVSTFSAVLIRSATAPPQWSTTDAEIKVPLCRQSIAIKGSPFQAWRRSEYSFSCFYCCQEFCFGNFFRLVSFSFISPQILISHKVKSAMTVNQIFTYDLTICILILYFSASLGRNSWVLIGELRQILLTDVSE